MSPSPLPIVVVGAGLSGLVAANLLRDRGHDVVVLDGATQAGGRARTDEIDGARLNLGPHALYRGGSAERLLRGLGAWPKGRRPPPKGALFGPEGLSALPGDTLSMLTTTALPGASRWAFSRWFTLLLMGLARADRGQGVSQWLQATLPNERARELALTLVRLATYTDDPDHVDATLARAQLWRATVRGVIYADGGWGTMVDTLCRRLGDRGGALRMGQPVLAVDEGGATLGDGQRIGAAATILALPLPAAAALTQSKRLTAAVASARPTRICALDLVVDGEIDPAIVLGLGQPYYHAVHSRFAQLAPAGRSVLHLAVPMGPRPSPGRAHIEALLERSVPGVLDRVRHARFHPAATVASDTPSAQRHGALTAVDAAQDHAPNLFLAGCGVEGGAFLLDGALRSAERAAEAAHTHVQGTRLPGPRPRLPAPRLAVTSAPKSEATPDATARGEGAA